MKIKLTSFFFHYFLHCHVLYSIQSNIHYFDPQRLTDHTTAQRKKNRWAFLPADVFEALGKDIIYNQLFKVEC